MATSYADITNQIEEQLRQSEIDTLLVEMGRKYDLDDIAVLLAKFIGYPRIMAALDENMKRIRDAEANWK